MRYASLRSNARLIHFAGDFRPWFGWAWDHPGPTHDDMVLWRQTLRDAAVYYNLTLEDLRQGHDGNELHWNMEHLLYGDLYD